MTARGTAVLPVWWAVPRLSEDEIGARTVRPRLDETRRDILRQPE